MIETISELLRVWARDYRVGIDKYKTIENLNAFDVFELMELGILVEDHVPEKVVCEFKFCEYYIDGCKKNRIVRATKENKNGITRGVWLTCDDLKGKSEAKSLFDEAIGYYLKFRIDEIKLMEWICSANLFEVLQVEEVAKNLYRFARTTLLNKQFDIFFTLSGESFLTDQHLSLIKRKLNCKFALVLVSASLAQLKLDTHQWNKEGVLILSLEDRGIFDNFPKLNHFFLNEAIKKDLKPSYAIVVRTLSDFEMQEDVHKLHVVKVHINSDQTPVYLGLNLAYILVKLMHAKPIPELLVRGEPKDYCLERNAICIESLLELKTPRKTRLNSSPWKEKRPESSKIADDVRALNNKLIDKLCREVVKPHGRKNKYTHLILTLLPDEYYCNSNLSDLLRFGAILDTEE